jgi:hypothetical protein
MIYGIDVGGVVKNQVTGLPIDGAIETLLRLIAEGHKVIFISKCRENFMKTTIEWLEMYDLSHIPIYFCETYPEKLLLAQQHGVQVMIDDKVTVLRHFSPEVFKLVWFCSEEKNIAGLRKHDPTMFHSFQLIRSWHEFEVPEC